MYECIDTRKHPKIQIDNNLPTSKYAHTVHTLYEHINLNNAPDLTLRSRKAWEGPSKKQWTSCHGSRGPAVDKYSPYPCDRWQRHLPCH